MATENLHTISFAQLPAQVRKLGTTFDPAEFKKGFIDGAAEYMLNKTKKNFKDSTDAEGNPWVSNAPKTKLGGRFSLDYNKRPSGETVSSSSVRLSDTKTLSNSYRILLKKFNRILVGPTGGRNLLIAWVASKWGNEISPFGEKQKQKLNEMFERYLKKKAKES